MAGNGVERFSGEVGGGTPGIVGHVRLVASARVPEALQLAGARHQRAGTQCH